MKGDGPPAEDRAELAGEGEAAVAQARAEELGEERRLRPTRTWPPPPMPMIRMKARLISVGLRVLVRRKNGKAKSAEKRAPPM